MNAPMSQLICTPARARRTVVVHVHDHTQNIESSEIQINISFFFQSPPLLSFYDTARARAKSSQTEGVLRGAETQMQKETKLHTRLPAIYLRSLYYSLCTYITLYSGLGLPWHLGHATRRFGACVQQSLGPRDQA